MGSERRTGCGGCRGAGVGRGLLMDKTRQNNAFFAFSCTVSAKEKVGLPEDSFADPSAQQAFRLMKAQQFSHGEGCFSVALQQAAQLRERVDAARGSSGFDQDVEGVIRIAKEDRFL